MFSAQSSNTKPNEQKPAEHDREIHFYDEYTPASQNGKYGIINSKNEAVLDFLFDEIRMERDTPFIVVKYKGYYGVIQKNF